eukprot:Opistho-1_new@19216
MSVSVPPDKLGVRLMRPDGTRQDFVLAPGSSVGEMKAHIFANWPDAWKAAAVESAGDLRIIHQGRFLNDHVLLTECGAPVGQLTVMHLAPKANVAQEPPAHPESSDSKTTGCTCTVL